MILSDKDIKKYLREGKLIIVPKPDENHIDSTTVDLRIGESFWVWNPALVSQRGVEVKVDMDSFDFFHLAKEYLRKVKQEPSGNYIIEPQKFYLVPTFEKIGLPRRSKLAARVEGKSSLARLGLVIHMTAPIIHCGYGEDSPRIITLEIYNYGPFRIMVTPAKSLICQLIIETVKTIPTKRTNRKFSKQTSPKG